MRGLMMLLLDLLMQMVEHGGQRDKLQSESQVLKRESLKTLFYLTPLLNMIHFRMQPTLAWELTHVIVLFPQ